MELNWSTFLLEILNFLVLLWILKRFLYKPILETIARRRAAIEKTLADARELSNEAQVLKSRYENRLAEWEQEKEAGREDLRREVAKERERQLAALVAELEKEREKARVLEERRQEDCLRKYQATCLEQDARFVSRLLSRLVGPELEERLFDLVLEQLEGLPAAQRDAIRLACEEGADQTMVVSAYPLDERRREVLARKLGLLLGIPVSCRFSEDAALMAGLRITMGAWILHANLQDELKSFTESIHEPG